MQTRPDSFSQFATLRGRLDGNGATVRGCRASEGGSDACREA
jgi:hypothetical protein